MIPLKSYHKYFTDQQLTELEATGPNWGVNVHTVGQMAHPSHRPYPDPGHPSSHAFQWEKGRELQEFQLVYIARGRGVYEGRETGELPVESGTVLFHFPGQWHRYKPLEETGWEEFWVGFDGHFADYLMQQACFDPQKPLIQLGFNAEFLDVFERLIEVVRLEGPAFRQISSCLVIQILGLVYASALLGGKTNLRQEQVVEAIRFQMHENWDQNPNLAQLSAAQNVSYEWFRKAFKQVTSVSPGQYLLNLKIEKTSQLLRETTLTIGEIAGRAGFESEFYFSRIFKKKTGVSPSEFRHRW